MGVQDRDWYRKDYKEREAKYGSDFSNNYHSTCGEQKSASDANFIIVPGGCSNCGKSFQIRVKRSEAENYSYTCPNCGRVTTVKSQTAEAVNSAEQSKALFAIAGSFFGAFLALLILSRFNFIWPVFIMLLYDLWMIVYVFTKKPKTGIGTRILAVIFFVFSVDILGVIIYLKFFVPYG